MTSDDTDADEDRREYVLSEVEFLAGTDWPDTLAQRLDYADAASLNCALARWQRPDLARKFERWRFDGLTPAGHIAQQQARQANRERQR